MASSDSEDSAHLGEAQHKPRDVTAQDAPPSASLWGAAGSLGPGVLQRKLSRRLARKSADAPAPASATRFQEAAERGTDGAGERLPHLDAIQRSFGPHDVTQVQAHTGSTAQAASQAMGAQAFTYGDHVAFGREPSLHLAAHEAAHVIQQRGGVSLKGSVGEPGDEYEQHADAVADRVVRGQSSADLLGPFAAASAHRVVQRYTEIPAGRYHAGSSGPAFASQKIEETDYGFHHTRSETGFDAEGDKYEKGTEAFDLDPVKKDESASQYAWNKGAAKEEVAGPKLNVSAGGLMAIETTGQPKWFYADDSIIAASNQTLKGVGSDVLLAPGGQTLTVPANPEDESAEPDKTITMVKPVKRQGDKAEVKKLEAYECNSFIEYVVNAGSAGRAAVLGAGDREVEVRAPSEREPKHAILGEVAKGEDDPAKVAAAAEKTPIAAREDRVGIEQGYRDRVKDHATPAALGINEHAAPNVGEGYVTVSNKEALQDVELDPSKKFPKPADGERESDAYLKALGQLQGADKHLDIMQQGLEAQVASMKGTWGYHYAAVVARHGADTVTFENYNRGTEQEWQVRRIFNNLFKDLEEFRQFVWARTESLGGGKLAEGQRKDLIVKAEAAIRDKSLVVSAATQQAIEEAKLTLSRPVPSPELIYFQMYGPASKGQSFHQKFAPDMATPLTLRLRNSPTLYRKECAADLKGYKDKLSAVLTGRTTAKPIVDGELVTLDSDLAALETTWARRLGDATDTATIRSELGEARKAFTDFRAAGVVKLGDALSRCVADFKKVATAPEVIKEVDRLLGQWYPVDYHGDHKALTAIKALLGDLNKVQL